MKVLTRGRREREEGRRRHRSKSVEHGGANGCNIRRVEEGASFACSKRFHGCHRRKVSPPPCLPSPSFPLSPRKPTIPFSLSLSLMFQWFIRSRQTCPHSFLHGVNGVMSCVARKKKKEPLQGSRFALFHRMKRNSWRRIN